MRAAALLLALLPAGCAGAGPAGGMPESLAPAAARLPETLSLLQRQEVTAVATVPPSLAVRYLHPPSQMRATVFLRDGGGAALADGIEAAPVQREVGGLTLLAIGVRGSRAVMRLPDHSLTIRGEAAPVLRCGNVLVPQTPEVTQRDMYCVGGLGGLLVTVAITGLVPKASEEDSQAVFSSIAVQAVRSLRGEDGSARPASPATPGEPAMPAATGRVFRL